MMARYFPMSATLKGKTVFITGASRGIGKAIALRVAKDGANVVVVAKTATPHAKLEGTIFHTAEEIEKLGGKALALQCDIRFEDQIQNAVKKAVETFGGIDILVNNASALFPQSVTELDMKRLDLIYSINVRGTFCVTKYVLPYLLKGKNPHILNLSPPISLNPKWLSPGAAYASTKYSMSLFVLGWAEEFKGKIAVNGLWPKTIISTAALRQIGDVNDLSANARTPEIMADAAHVILTQPISYSGNLTIDEGILASQGVKDFKKYAFDPSKSLMPDYFIEDGYVFNLPGEKREPSSEVSNANLSIPGFKASDYFSAINSNLMSLPKDKQKAMSDSTKAIFEFEIHNAGGKCQTWTIDLKSGKPNIALGKISDTKPDISLVLSDEDFCHMATGKITGQKLFMSGKLKIRGNVMMATKLDTILKSAIQKSRL